MKLQGTGSVLGVGGFLDLSLNLQFYKMKLSYCLWHLQFLLNKIGIFILSLFIRPFPLLPSFIYCKGLMSQTYPSFSLFSFLRFHTVCVFLYTVQLNDMVRIYAFISMSVAE